MPTEELSAWVDPMGRGPLELRLDIAVVSSTYKPGYLSEYRNSGRCGVNAWGVVSKQGLVTLVRESPSFTADAYCVILDGHLLPYARDGPFEDR
ncbi:hypothetical protein HPB49_004216 [Dermacentor silvarum]|uniref:Uncharacterized protein n=1 Tax=Dermacentor silvarum TaxID=543639 RepID=A0ACB8CV49_DERSI|nr:hypothetical protein HPB49_004216 [Dermacentor silvarum]